MCFRLVLRRSLVKWKKLAFPSPLKLWNCREFTSEYVSTRNICSLSPYFNSEKRKQDDRGRTVMPYLGLARIFYAVVFGAIHAECIGEDSVSLSREDQENTTINTPSDNVKVRDSSGRFSSSTKLVKTKERKSHAIDLLKGINSAKKKLDFNMEQEGEQKERWKRATRSVTVSFFCFQFVYKCSAFHL